MQKQDVIDYIKSHLDRPIVLIGMMGVGKTKIGRDLASALSLPFIDSDDEIVAAAGMSVADIFERFGEPHFRDGEHRVIKRLLEEGVKVISTGGGAVMTPDTADLIWQNTISVWIKADIEDILKRTMHNREKRPLLMQDSPEKVLKDLLSKRQSTYSRANIHVGNGFDSSPDTCIEDILNKIKGVLEK